MWGCRMVGMASGWATCCQHLHPLFFLSSFIARVTKEVEEKR